MKQILLAVAGVFYGLYIIWCLSLMTLLPTTNPNLVYLKSVGLFTALVGGIVFLIVGAFLLQRSTRPLLSADTKVRGIVRIALAVIPGLLISGIMPLMIIREPVLPMLYSPDDPAQLVAPLAVTFSLEQTVSILQQLKLRPLEYSWSNNGVATEKTVTPKTTIMFQRAGIYTVSANISLSNGTKKRVSKRLIIGEEEFTVSPPKPIVEQPAKFTIASLLNDPKLLSQVQWDFDSDGIVDEVTKTPEIMHTFYIVEKVKVTAIVDLTNQTRRTYEKEIDVGEPPPLPFSLTLETDPQKLVGPVPLGVYFYAKTEEPLREIYWGFGDGQNEQGPNVTRVSHVYKTPGTYGVVLRVRSASGEIAQISQAIIATPVLSIQDLTFDGTPEMDNNTLKGEVPLSVDLTPKTNQPLVQFYWEYPEDLNAEVKGAEFRSVFRHEGTYEIKLLAQEPEGSSVRIPIKIIATPPSAQPKIDIRPETGSAPLHVFFDASNTFIPENEKVAGFLWDFGDKEGGSKEQSGSSRMEYTYQKPGEYHVKLTVVTTNDKQYVAERTIIVLSQRITACGTASRLSVLAGGAIQFDASCSSGEPSTYLWDVRGEDRPNTIIAQSSDIKFVHVFEQAGTYSVTLTVENGDGASDSKTLSITVNP